MARPPRPGLRTTSPQRDRPRPRQDDLPPARNSSSLKSSLASDPEIHIPTEQKNIEAFISSIFKAELQLYSAQAQLARQQVEEQIASGRSSWIWFSVQAVITLAGNASKLLWGEGAEEARKRLRDEAGVEERSRLRGRGIRNSLEHFDEEVIKWAKQGTFFIQRDVGAMAKASLAGAEFGRFDPITWEVSFLKETSINLKEVLDELDAIATRLDVFT